MNEHLPPGLYLDDTIKGLRTFFYKSKKASKSYWGWYELGPLYEEWRRPWAVAECRLRQSSPLEFVLLTGNGFDPAPLEADFEMYKTTLKQQRKARRLVELVQREARRAYREKD